MPVQTSYPGVYIEERPSGVRTIVGVSTSITAFVGGCSFGPTNTPTRVTSTAAYHRLFGPSISAAQPMGHMVGHYFANGGSEAVIVRVAGAGAAPASATLQDASPANTLILDAASPGVWANRVGSAGLSAVVNYATSNPDDLFTLTLQLRAVNPATGNVQLTAEERHENLSMSPASPRYVNLVLENSGLVDIATTSPAPGGAVAGTSTGTALPTPIDITPANNVLRVAVDYGPPIDLVLATGSHNRGQLRTAVANAASTAGAGITVALDGSNRLVLTSITTGPNSSVTVLPAPNDASAACLLGRANGGSEVSGSAALRPVAATTTFTGGNDGAVPTASAIVPASGTGGIYGLGSRTFPRFNLLVLPGVTSASAQEVGAALAYCRQERAFLLVDTPTENTPGGWVTDPPALGSIPAQGEHGALYYPRLQVFETRPGGRRVELDLPPAGAVAGVFAATDRSRGVWKAPAGRSAGIVGASGLTAPTDDDLSGQLNPRGVNVLRNFPGAGTVIWGARTLRGDDNASSEFKYVPIRRLTDFIASSLYLGTAFAVFEPNDPTLWGQLRLAVNTFMKRLFDQGAFQQSAKRAESDSFFVVCDETVNPQAEIDLGRVNVVVGFAPLKPAEFVIITITQISALEE
jgi:uncharacterized protein